MTEIRTMALETFLPCTSLLRILFDMKYSTDKRSIFSLLKYTKDLALKSIFLFLIVSCSVSEDSTLGSTFAQANESHPKIIVGAERTSAYFPLLEGKKVGIVGNQTSLIHQTHLVDSLIAAKIDVVKVFSPEHGFRGTADAGAKVNSSIDPKTNLPIVSLYGKNKKPTQEQLEGIDIVIFDIQDVGVRFYTYISTLDYVMEACAEANIPLIVLDRPNPNGHYIDGPILEEKYQSFVGMHPVPVVYGMTIGEYAQMINGEHWLENNLQCELTVIELENYTHQSKYSLPVAPSPNLKSDRSINLYPSLCFFEGTSISVGRGTSTPFEIYGHPKFPNDLFSFTPTSMTGSSNPKLKGEKCFGYNLGADTTYLKELTISYLINAQQLIGNEAMFNNDKFFCLLAGNDTFLEQLKSGKTEFEIRESWQAGLDKFKIIRTNYLLYK